MKARLCKHLQQEYEQLAEIEEQEAKRMKYFEHFVVVACLRQGIEVQSLHPINARTILLAEIQEVTEEQAQQFVVLWKDTFYRGEETHG